MDINTRNAPLAGLKAVELHAIGPIPFVGHLMSMLGAQVTRVSPPTDRGIGLSVPEAYDILNRHKDKRRLDLKTPEGLCALHDEIAASDILLEGFRPGVLERLGVKPLELLDRYPRLIIGRLSGWGSRGDLAQRAGHDINYLARSGVLSAIGSADEPSIPLNLVGDYGGGAMHLLIGVLSKLVQRSIHHHGGIVETSILAGTIGLSRTFYAQLASGMWNEARASNILDGGVPFYRTYRCADERFIAVGAIEPKFYQQLLEVTGIDTVLHPKDQYVASSWPQTISLFEQRFATKTRDEWDQIARDTDACISAVLSFSEAARDAHNLANDFFRSEPFPEPADILRFI